MKVRIECAPAYSMAYLHLAAGESVICEPGAMVALSGGIAVSMGVGPGGITRAAARKLLGGERFLVGRYRAEVDGAWVAVAPRYPGDVAPVTVDPHAPLLVQTGAFLASSEGVFPDVAYGGLKTLMLHEGITTLRLHGSGEALIASYGGLQRFTVSPGQQLRVDTGHLVAWSAHAKLGIHLLGDVVTATAVGEGLVGLLECPAGAPPATVWVQTRSEQLLRSWLMPKRAQDTGRV